MQPDKDCGGEEFKGRKGLAKPREIGSCLFSALTWGSANDGHRPAVRFISSFVGTQLGPFTDAPSVTAFAPQESRVVATETIWCAEPKLFTGWPLTEDLRPNIKS